MRIPDRRPTQTRRGVSAVGRAAALALALAWTAGASEAREVTVSGAQMTGHGRIELRFDETTKVRARTTNGILLIAFDKPARIKPERLVAELAPYVSVVRRDPDGSGLRIALVGTVRPNVLEAGERVFVDLLPPSWRGLPPALPPEVVAELAERARVAEAKAKAGEVARTPAPGPVLLRLAELPTLTRLVFEAPAGTAIDLRGRNRDGTGTVQGSFAGRLALELPPGVKPMTAAGVADVSSESGDGSLTVKVTAAPGYSAHGFVEGDTLVVDLAKPSARAASAPPAAASGQPAAPPKAEDPAGTAPERTRQEVASAKAAPEAPSSGPSRDVPAPVPAPVAVRSEPGTVVPVVEQMPDGASILFPFRTATAAAAFMRGGELVLAFSTSDRIEKAALAKADVRVISLDELRSERGLALLRMTPADGLPVRLLSEGDGWRLAVGREGGLPPDEVPVTRTLDADGRSQVALRMAGATAVHWVDLQGSRLAVVTARGRPQGLARSRHFVEFDLPATLQGAAVAARADDLAVSLGQGGALVSGRRGLSVSSVESPGELRPGRTPVIVRDSWQLDAAGDVLGRYRALVAATAEAPPGARTEARFRLARFLLANGMAPEAASLLGFARADDPGFGRRRETLILSSVAAFRAGRHGEARELLSNGVLSDDPEAVLWRAMLDARSRQWANALRGFRRSGEVLGRYPDDLAGAARLATLKAALELGDLPAAEAAMLELDRLTSGAVPRDEHDLARARLDEKAGRLEAASKTFDRLAENGSRPVAAEAELGRITLGTRSGRLVPEAGIERLEALAVSWRGDETELGTLVELARLYAAAGRWREMFATARRANGIFPNHDATRALHDETARRFEALLLGRDSAGLSAVETLALYYDFKDFAPIGRRGDELVRYLADKLVELDLLDQAADLLQHQVDKRLTGAARAAVAARLAAVRLMSGKPALALTALRSTRLAEVPAEVRRFRLLLEAQAEADLTRTDLALEMIEGEEGVEFARLRAAILFGASRWREAGEASEGLVGTRWQGTEPLSDTDRADVIRAAVAYALAEEAISADRLRTRFAPKMADSPDARTFELLLRPGAVRTREFRAALREAGRADGVRKLLDGWTGGREGPVAAPVREAPAVAPTAAQTGAGLAPSGRSGAG